MIKRVLFCALYVFSFLCLTAQGYNKGYWLSSTGGSSYNALCVRGDSVFIGGIIRDTSTSYAYLPMYALLNIDSQLYFSSYTRLDSLEGANYGTTIVVDGENILLTAYGASNGHFASNISALVKQNKNGHTLYHKIFSDSVNQSQGFISSFKKPSGAGYFTIGTEQLRSGDNNIFYYDFDDSLHLLRKREIIPFNGNACENVHRTVMLDSNRYAILGTQTSCSGHIEILHNMIVAIKSNGDTLRTWVDSEQDSLIINDLIVTNDGGYIAGGIKLDTVNNSLGIRVYGAVVAKLDSDYNRIWIKPVGTLYFTEVAVNRIIPVDSATFLAVGQDWDVPEFPPTSCGYKVAFIEKRLISNGGLIWRRNYKNLSDTSCFPVHGQWDENQLHDIAILYDHSILACGEFVNWGDTIHTQQGWLIRVNENGCFSPDCSDTSWMNAIGKIPFQNLRINIFPNPTTDQMALEVISRGEAVKDATLSVYNLQGQLVRSYAHIDTQTTYFLQTKNFSAGNYILRLEENGQLLGTAKLSKE
jgi:Secretion system C-terminal sorting domain